MGATSAIAQETARLFAADGDRLYLVGRNEEKLKTLAADLSVRSGASVPYRALDLTDTAPHAGIVAEAARALSGLDTVLIAHGTLPNQQACQDDVALMEQEFRTNFVSAASLLTHIANHFERQGHGCISVISSVAGDRGRKSNYVYGAAKGALSIFLEGLRHRLHKAGVQVLTIKPGFVDTPMTREFKKGLLWASPRTVARGIHRAINKNKGVVYLPGFWRGIMTVIKGLPAPVFHKLEI